MPENLDDPEMLVARLNDQECLLLCLAIHQGPLVCPHLTRSLLHAYLLICGAEERPAVIVIPRRASMWKLIVVVPDLGWLPRVVQQLVESGGSVLGVLLLLCGVVIAHVAESQAEAAARAIAASGIHHSQGAEGRG